jgi:translation initiation factor 3 subunit A
MIVCLYRTSANKYALDMVNLGTGTREKQTALESLHSAITGKKKNNWSKAYENLMRKHIELCVDLRDQLTAKDGLHQYRNLCINVSI